MKLYCAWILSPFAFYRLSRAIHDNSEFTVGVIASQLIVDDVEVFVFDFEEVNCAQLKGLIA